MEHTFKKNTDIVMYLFDLRIKLPDVTFFAELKHIETKIQQSKRKGNTFV